LIKAAIIGARDENLLVVALTNAQGSASSFQALAHKQVAHQQLGSPESSARP